MKNFPGSPYAKAVEKMRADKELVKLPTRVVKDSAASNATVNVSEISTKGAKASKVVKNSSGAEQAATSTPRLISHGLYYHFTDHLGSSNIVTDEAGNIVEISDYYPYGKARVQEKTDPAFANKKQFTGKEKDASGLTYFGARYYDERLGRFTQVDRVATFSPHILLTLPQRLNAYAYANNNPMIFVDPDGNFSYEAAYQKVAEITRAFVNWTLGINTAYGPSIADDPVGDINALKSQVQSREGYEKYFWAAALVSLATAATKMIQKGVRALSIMEFRMASSEMSVASKGQQFQKWASGNVGRLKGAEKYCFDDLCGTTRFADALVRKNDELWELKNYQKTGSFGEREMEQLKRYANHVDGTEKSINYLFSQKPSDKIVEQIQNEMKKYERVKYSINYIDEQGKMRTIN